MDQSLAKSNPLSTSYRETFRRHRKLFCMPIILGALAASVFLFGMGSTYKSTASLWVDTTPPLQSSVGATNGNLPEPPAAAVQAILNELLTTRAFAASVGETLLHEKSPDSAAAQEQAAGLLGQGQLVQTVPGAQLLQITYSASSPAMAERVLAAIVAQLRNYIDRATAQHDQAAIAYNRDQVKGAETALATARNNLTAYLARHPATRTDPNYMSLFAAETNAVSQVTLANNALSQVTGPSNANSWSMQVTDPPDQATTTPLTKRKMVEVIVGGALGGLLVSFLAVVALTPAKKEAWEDELPTGGPFIPPVPPADPFGAGSPGVPTAAAQSASPATAVGQVRLSLGDRRFQVRSRSVSTNEQ